MKIRGFVFAFAFVLERQANSPRCSFAFAFVMSKSSLHHQQTTLTNKNKISKIFFRFRFRNPAERNWEFPTWLFQTWLFAILRGSALLRSFAPFYALLRSFADLRLHSFAHICALLRAFTCFCVRLRLERPRLGTAEENPKSRDFYVIR